MGETLLTAALGSLTDGSPPGEAYAPSTDCSWRIVPGYSRIRSVHGGVSCAGRAAGSQKHLTSLLEVMQ